MIPYWPQPEWTVGPLTIHAFGLVQAIALLSGYALVLIGASRRGLDVRRAAGLFVAGVLVALLTGAVWHYLVSGRPGEDSGGMLAGSAAVAVIAWIRFGSTALSYLDLFALCAPSVAAIARFGCFLAHDHRGRPGTGPLAVRFPEGPRLDLGLVQFVACLVLLFVVFLLNRKRLAPGLLAAFVLSVAVALRFLVAALST